eukprot:2447295-Rhodomonas_salina.2
MYSLYGICGCLHLISRGEERCGGVLSEESERQRPGPCEQEDGNQRSIAAKQIANESHSASDSKEKDATHPIAKKKMQHRKQRRVAAFEAERSGILRLFDIKKSVLGICTRAQGHARIGFLRRLLFRLLLLRCLHDVRVLAAQHATSEPGVMC